MKAILMSIKPQWVSKILNGEKTIEIRKKFPKDYVGWVYIYCCKDKKYANLINRGGFLTGMVVARFWCDKVEEITCRPIWGEWECYTKTLGYSEIAKASCLENREIVHYLKGKLGYAIHITNLEIFDKPKEIKDLSVVDHEVVGVSISGEETSFKILKPLSRAPQSWCYIYE